MCGVGSLIGFDGIRQKIPNGLFFVFGVVFEGRMHPKVVVFMVWGCIFALISSQIGI